jgi:hypothetical protein
VGAARREPGTAPRRSPTRPRERTAFWWMSAPARRSAWRHRIPLHDRPVPTVWSSMGAIRPVTEMVSPMDTGASARTSSSPDRADRQRTQFSLRRQTDRQGHDQGNVSDGVVRLGSARRTPSRCAGESFLGQRRPVHDTCFGHRHRWRRKALAEADDTSLVGRLLVCFPGSFDLGSLTGRNGRPRWRRRQRSASVR